MKISIIICCIVFISQLSATIINVPTDQSTIQEGINIAVDADTVLVQPGTYFENINYNGKDITVASLFLTTQDTTYISQTIIDGNGNNGCLVAFTSGETGEAQLIGLTIRNGYGYMHGSYYEDAGGVGIYILNSSPLIESNIIEDNNCYWYVNGCGIGIQNSSATINNNIIRNNNGAYFGGAIYVYQSEGVVIENNIINGHLTQSGYGEAYGAGICINQSNNILITKNLIYDNTVDFGNGGGVALRTSSANIFNNTIFNNSYNEWGNNVYIDKNSTVEIKNSILWSDDTNFGVEIASQGIVDVSYSNIRGGYDGIGNMSRNPLFEDIINRDFHLTLQSSCINSGDPTSAYDLDGTIADMGYCYFDMSDYGSLSGLVTLEPGIGDIGNVIVTIDSFSISPFSDGYYIFNLLPGYYDITASLGLHYEQTINNVQVIQNEVTTGIDFSLENTNTNIVIEINQAGTGDFTAIQEGIDIAINGDTILVYPGIYYENINILSKNIILGSRFLTTGDSAFISETIIDGNNEDSTISIENVADTSCVISGFTIRNGNAVINGGGIYCYYSSPQILNCHITENYSDSYGGGIFCNYSNPIIKNNEIYNNSSVAKGAGIASYDSDPVLINNDIHNNTATHSYSYGGGLHFRDSSPSIINCTISDNISSVGGAISFMYSPGYSLINNSIKNNIANSGGGLYFHGQSNGVVINNLIVNNHASYSGGALFSSNSNPNLINNTISNNIADSCGGGLFFTSNNHSNIFNTIIYGNEAEIGEQICLNSSNSDPNFYYSNIEDGLNGFGFTGTTSIEEYEGEYENNILLDPLFIEPEAGNFHLIQNSPCINTGTPDTIGLNLPEYDLAGDSRIYDGIIDIGCFEWQGVSVDDLLNSVSIKPILNANYPNPFNPTTTISFSIPEESKVDLSIYNIKGQRVKSLVKESFESGNHSVVWNGVDDSGKSVGSGVYFYKLNVNGKSKLVKKCLLLK